MNILAGFRICRKVRRYHRQMALLVGLIFLLVFILNMARYMNYYLMSYAHNLDDFSLLKMKQTEIKYKEKVESLSAEQLESLNKRYYRNVSIHWSSDYGLLPPSKPLADPACARHFNQKFPQSVSVVMCYRNELVYLLLRTLTTLSKRTPPELLAEVLLIDDASDEESAKESVKESAKEILQYRCFIAARHCKIMPK